MRRLRRHACARPSGLRPRNTRASRGCSGGALQHQSLMAAATFSMIPTLVVFLIAQRHFVKSIAMGGLKG